MRVDTSRRVLHVNDYAPDALGGAEVLMSRTVQLLSAAGWSVRTFSKADLPDPRLTPRRYMNNPIARRALRDLLAEFQPSVVHLHNFYHLLSPGILPDLADYKRRTGARVVATAHDYHLVCPNSGGNWFHRGPRLADVNRLQSWRYLLSRRWDHRGRSYSMLKLAQHVWHYRLHDRRRIIDEVLCTCRFLRDLVVRVGLPATHLPNPSPPRPIGPQPVRPKELTLLFAGRAEPEKGLRRFLEILPKSFAGRFVIVGDGADRPACEALARERGLSSRVEFLGRRTHAETVALIAGAHVVVVPSLLFETYPLVAQEAFSVGTNALVADYGGMREVVLDAGMGFRFRPDQPETLAEQLAAIESTHANGTLNDFDVREFLAERTEETYLRGLERAYVVR